MWEIRTKCDVKNHRFCKITDIKQFNANTKKLYNIFKSNLDTLENSAFYTSSYLLTPRFLSLNLFVQINLKRQKTKSRQETEIMLTAIKIISKQTSGDNIFKYHVFASMGRFQLELIYLYFPPSFHLTVVISVLQALRC